MARRLGDRLGLATVLMRSYWSRGEGSLEETLEMLSEARELAEALGETDLQAEAMEWRVAGLIALGDLRAAERELAEVHAMAVRLRQPFTLHVAEHYASTLALCAGQARRGRGRRAALARMEPSAHGPRRLRDLRHPDVRDPARAGPPRRARCRHQRRSPAANARAARGDRVSRRCWPSSAMDDEARRELARVREEGFDELRSDAVGGVADVSDRRLRGSSATSDWPACCTPSWLRWPAATS